MRKVPLTAFWLIIFICSAQAQKIYKDPPIRFETKPNYKKEKKIELQYIESWFSYIPATTYTMADEQKVSAKAFYMMRFEVPNMLYKLFIQDLEAKGKTDEMALAMPDTNAWGEHHPIYIHTYFQQSRYNDYPVVSVSREGIDMFCIWLGEQVKQLKLKVWKDKTVTFRLPGEVEWMIAASGGDTNAVYAWKGPYMRMGNGPWGGDYRANFRRVGDESVVRGEDGNLTVVYNTNKKYRSHFSGYYLAEITAPIHNYWPNAYGLYCMTGNVREMVLEEGFTKGGGWIDPGGECMIDFRNTFKKEGYPCEGFRIIAVVE